MSAESAAAHYGVTPTAARAALNRLESTEVLVPVRVGRRRDREWISEELFQLLDGFEHSLGENCLARSRVQRPHQRGRGDQAESHHYPSGDVRRPAAWASCMSVTPGRHNADVHIAHGITRF